VQFVEALHTLYRLVLRFDQGRDVLPALPEIGDIHAFVNRQRHLTSPLVCAIISVKKDTKGLSMLIYTISELRRGASEIVNQVIEQDDIVLITRFGKPVAILLLYESYNMLVKQLDDLEDALALYQRQDDERVPF